MIKRAAIAFLQPLIRLTAWLAHKPFFRYHPRIFGALQYSPHEQMTYHALYFARTSRLEGDYLEFGVYDGHSFISAYHCARLLMLDQMRFYAFDSFEGLPEPAGVDAGGFAHFEKGQYRCDLDQFERNLVAKSVDLGRVHCVKGFYRDTLTEATKRSLPLRVAAIVWIDCDLYESTVQALDFVVDYVQDGTVMIFDDWFAYRADPNRGERRAFAEWLGRHPELSATEYHRFGVCGMSFILNRRAGA